MNNSLAAVRTRVALAGGFTVVVIACGSVVGNPGLNDDGGGNGTSASSSTSSGSTASSTTGSTGSTSGSSGASSSGPPATCSSNVAACGGSVVGTWTATSSCLSVSGQVDMTQFGLGCTSAPVTGSLQVTGTWTANSDGTYSDNTTTSGSEQLMLPASCLLISGTTTTCDDISGPLQAAGYASVTCTPLQLAGAHARPLSNKPAGWGWCPAPHRRAACLRPAAT